MAALETVEHLKHKLNEAEFQQFYSIENTLDSLSVFSYRFQPLVDPENLVVRPVGVDYKLFNLFLVESLGILSAYMFTSSYNVTLSRNYVKVIQPSAQHIRNFKGVKLLMQDTRLNIFHSNDGAALISVNGLKEVIKPNMVRKSSKTDEESE